MTVSLFFSHNLNVEENSHYGVTILSFNFNMRALLLHSFHGNGNFSVNIWKMFFLSSMLIRKCKLRKIHKIVLLVVTKLYRTWSLVDLSKTWEISISLTNKMHKNLVCVTYFSLLRTIKFQRTLFNFTIIRRYVM